jgi:hypothetical protein
LRALILSISTLWILTAPAAAHAQADCASIDSDVHRFNCEELQRAAAKKKPKRTVRAPAPSPEDARTEATVVAPERPCVLCGYRNPVRLSPLPVPTVAAVNRTDTSTCSRQPPTKPKRIIVGFDGMGGYSPLNKFLMEIGSRFFFPFGGSVIRNYIQKAVDQDPKNTHWEYFHHLASSPLSSGALRCIQALATTGYRARDGRIVYPTVTIVGHSFGGAAAHDLVQRLNRLGIAVDLVVTADARARDGINDFRADTARTGRWLNFEQQNDFLPGYSVAGASNFNLSSSGANHMTIPSHPTSQYYFERSMAYMPSCKPSFSRPVQRLWYNSCPVN